MDINQIHALIDNRSLPGKYDNVDLIETHISWIILTDDFAYKIKRPVHYSFVNFSSLGKRKHFCKKEIALNSRLAPEMYLEVLPVTTGMVTAEIGKDHDDIIDFAVRMKRMDNSREMDKLLAKNEVTSGEIDKLALKIAGFHNRVDVIDKQFDIKNIQETFSDIETVAPYLKKTAGENMFNKVTGCIESSNRFLKENEALINKRAANGFRRDCHGDLNSYNIFLYPDPVIFDCIEFNDEFRHIDVLYDIAFLCVDLDFFGRTDLAEQFCKTYFEESGISADPAITRLLDYYKSLRANIRAKVTLINARDSEKVENKEEIADAKKYLELMAKYTPVKQ